MSIRRDHIEILLEEMNSKFDFIVEVVVGMREEMKTLAKQEDLDALTKRVDVGLLAIKETNVVVSKHEKRISHLEQLAS